MLESIFAILTFAFKDISFPIVVLLGAFTGIVELMGRYRDAPGRALSTPGAVLYVTVNVAAAVIGLYLLRTIGAELLKDYSTEKRVVYEVLIAGFGSLAFLRSSIFNIRLDGKDVSVGPAILLDVLLATADRSVDRRRGADRAREVAEAMKDISFDKAITSLPPFCFALMQNLSLIDQPKILEEVKKIHDQVAIDPRVKSLLLGLLLMNHFSVNVLRAAVDELGDQIKYDVEPPGDKPSANLVSQLLNEVRRAAGTARGAVSTSASAPQSATEQTATPASGNGALRSDERVDDTRLPLGAEQQDARAIELNPSTITGEQPSPLSSRAKPSRRAFRENRGAAPSPPDQPGRSKTS